MRGFVIWSFEHRQWWRPNQAGYTPRLEEAGRYTSQEAGEITTSSTLCRSVAIHEKIAENHGPPTVSSLWMKVDEGE